MSATNFVETEALLALLNGDPEECESLLSKMHPGELLELARVATDLAERAQQVRQHIIVSMMKSS